MKLAVAYLAATGFLVSAIAHIAAILGKTPGGDSLLFAYFGGVFVVFFPTVLMCSRKFPKGGSKFTWNEVLKYCPAPIRILFYVTFAYAIGSMLFLWSQGTKTKHRFGDPLTANTARGFSGHAMAFYICSTAIMLSLHREEQEKKPNQSSQPTSLTRRG